MKLFNDGRSIEQKIEDAISLLRDYGYSVRPPSLTKAQLDAVPESKYLLTIVRYFYEKLVEYNTEYRLQYSGNMKRDLGIAKAFLESRELTGISKKAAFLQCCEIIGNLFTYQHLLGLNNPITSMSILNQTVATAWVTEKLLDICNNINRDLEEVKEEFWFDSLYDEQERNRDSKLLDSSIEKMDKYLETYGKEKKG